MALPTSSRTDVAQALADRIVAALRPWRIVLFGSRARGTARPDSDYDLYVEIDDTERSARESHDAIHSLLAKESTSVDLKVNRPGTIERRRDDPGTIEWDVARDGRLLYADPEAPHVLAPPPRVREPGAKEPESVEEWIEVAERDVRHCELLRNSADDYSPEICWLSHQMCEKYMKALLVSRWVRPERTHKLGVLLAALRAAGCPLAGLDGDCALLTKHAITPRYPKGLSLNARDAAAAYAAARRVLEAVQSELPSRQG